jgi:RNA recognition motif-containing protein
MSQFGDVDACTIMRDPTGRSRGFAFLTFVDPESVDRAVAHKGHELDGKTVRLLGSMRSQESLTLFSPRLIRKGPFPGRSIFATKGSSLVACHPLSRARLYANTSRSMVRLWTVWSCWIARRTEAKASALSPIRMLPVFRPLLLAFQ